MSLILPHSKIVKAIYKPRQDVDHLAYLDNSTGQEFDFREARPVGAERKFWPTDKNFPSSTPVSEYDLQLLPDLADTNYDIKVDNDTVPTSN